MNTEMILKSDSLDILFENRNKLYGAYPLRKFYQERVKTALVMMLSLVIAFSLFAVFGKRSTPAIAVFDFIDPALGAIEQPKKIEEPKPKNHSVEKAVLNSQKNVSSVKMVKDSADKLTENLDNIPIRSSSITGGLGGINIVGQDEGTPAPTGEVIVKELPAPDPLIPIDNPDVQPTFPGGINALRAFLQKNLVNPRDMEAGEEISVKIKFIVGYDGKLQHFESLQEGEAEFNNEVMRVLKKMPQWIAGKSNGKNVSVYYTVPVKFVPND